MLIAFGVIGWLAISPVWFLLGAAERGYFAWGAEPFIIAAPLLIWGYFAK